MKKISLFAIVLLFQSCSQWSASSWRNPAASDLGDGPVETYDFLGCQSQPVTPHEIHYSFQGKLFSFHDNQLRVTELDDCSSEDYALKSSDRFMTVVAAEDHLYLHSLHGKVFRFKAGQLHLLSIPFPVSSFEIDQQRMSIYSANDQGRFCSFAELQKQKHHRDPSCRSIALELPLSN